MWDLTSMTKDRTCTLCIGRQSLNQVFPAREVPRMSFSPFFFSLFFSLPTLWFL